MMGGPGTRLLPTYMADNLIFTLRFWATDDCHTIYSIYFGLTKKPVTKQSEKAGSVRDTTPFAKVSKPIQCRMEKV